MILFLQNHKQILTDLIFTSWKEKRKVENREFCEDQNQSLITDWSCLGCNLTGRKKLFYYSSKTFIIYVEQTFTFTFVSLSGLRGLPINYRQSPSSIEITQWD